MNIALKNYRFAAIIEHDDDGWFAYCPELQGCHAQGDSYEELIVNIRDVVQLIVEDRRVLLKSRLSRGGTPRPPGE